MKHIFESDENEIALLDETDGSIVFKANGRIDGDGSGPSHGDPCFQSDTTLHFNGKALNAEVDRFIVLPPAIVKSVPGIVLGSQAFVMNVRNGKSTYAVVGDIGPKHKLGEISSATAVALGLSGNPNSGGTDDFILNFTVWPGKPAIVEGKQYSLQAWRT